MSTQVYERIIGIAVKIARETDVHRLCSVLLQEAQSITGAQGGTLYLAAENENAEAVALEFVIVRNSVLKIDNDKAYLPPVQLYNEQGEAITNADGGTIFMLNDKQETPQLEFSLMVNDPWISIRAALTAWRKKLDRQFSAGAPGEHWPFRWIAVFLNQSGWSGNGQDEHAGPFSTEFIGNINIRPDPLAAIVSAPLSGPGICVQSTPLIW